ncbi:hypothetical protein DM02DRAFT_351623 [Periconia macrospinosa]|uniref:Uncharacterized protein n=1 Tax=Periconia macrospinosa TaxID=97972 RepID=A0A2V1ECX4_9PLEO|nr:hypothetical protein DM02DRAFT_351623 [Periconia macrospinosa]
MVIYVGYRPCTRTRANCTTTFTIRLQAAGIRQPAAERIVDCLFPHHGATAQTPQNKTHALAIGTVEMAQLSLRGVSRELAATVTLLLLLSILIITLVPVQIIVRFIPVNIATPCGSLDDRLTMPLLQISFLISGQLLMIRVTSGTWATSYDRI